MQHIRRVEDSAQLAADAGRGWSAVPTRSLFLEGLPYATRDDGSGQMGANMVRRLINSRVLFGREAEELSELPT